MTGREYRLPIAEEFDVTRAALQARRCATAAGFDATKVALLATTVSELGTNVLKYAGAGEVVITAAAGPRAGITVRVTDRGPGIADLAAAMRDHHSTGGTLGLGLPGVRRMMDEFDIRSAPGAGTTVTVTKWK
jgi:anti-sigma regulatory factor (Ser/Thr protein kinase)